MNRLEKVLTDVNFWECAINYGSNDPDLAEHIAATIITLKLEDDNDELTTEEFNLIEEVVGIVGDVYKDKISGGKI